MPAKLKSSEWRKASNDSIWGPMLVVENLPANAGDVRDAGSVPGWGRSPGGRHGNPLHYSCLENPMNRGDRRIGSQRVRHNWSDLAQHTQMCYGLFLKRSMFEEVFWAQKVKGICWRGGAVKCQGPGRVSNLISRRQCPLFTDIFPRHLNLKVLCLIFVILNCLVFFKVFISS